MTVSNENYTKQVTLATPTDAIATLIHILDEDHLLVTRTRSGLDTTLVKTTDYTVSNVGVEAGCTVTMVGQLAGDIITITRLIPFTQQGDYTSGFTFPPETNESNHDQSVHLAQQLQEEIDRCIKFPVADSGGAYGQEIPSLLLRPGTAPSVDNNGVLQWTAGGSSAAALFGNAATKTVPSLGTVNLVDVTIPSDEAAKVTLMVSFEGYGVIHEFEYMAFNKAGSILFEGPLETEWSSNATGADRALITVAVSGSNHRFQLSGALQAGVQTVDARWKIEPFNNEANISYTAL